MALESATCSASSPRSSSAACWSPPEAGHDTTFRETRRGLGERRRREYNLGGPHSTPGHRMPATTVMTRGLLPEVACRVAAGQFWNARLRRAEVTR